MSERYNRAIEEVSRLLGEDSTDNPKIAALNSQKEQIQKRIDALDAQRKPLVLQLQQINIQLTQAGAQIQA